MISERYQDQQWKPVTWYEQIPSDKYWVSDKGHVWNDYSETVLKTCYTDSGYGYCVLNDCARTFKRKWGVHTTHCSCNMWISVAVAKLFLPDPLIIDRKHLVVHHKDGNIQNNDSTNLEWRIGCRRETSMRPEVRFQILTFIKQHEEQFPTEVHKLVVEEFGPVITSHQIAQLMGHDREGNPRSKQWAMFGITPPKKRSLKKRFPEELIHAICQLLCEYNGSTVKVKRVIKERKYKCYPELVNEILTKRSHAKISDQYFVYDRWGTFRVIKK